MAFRRSPVLPAEFNGSLDYSKCCPRDVSECHDVASHLEYNPYLRVPERQVSLLNLSWCQMALFSESSFQRAVRAVGAFHSLQVVRLEGSGVCAIGCNVGADRLLRLVQCVIDLPHFKGTALAGERCTTVELSIPANRLGDGWVSQLLRSARHPRSGLEVLVASDNQLTDKGVNYIAGLFPSLSKLYLDGNQQVTLANASEVLQRLPNVTHIDVNSTSVASVGVLNIMKVMKARLSKSPVTPLTISAKALSSAPDEKWMAAMDFCNKASAKTHFAIDHDFKFGLGNVNRCLMKCHEEIRIRIYINRAPSIVVTHRNVMATRGVWNLASAAIEELNVACMQEEGSKIKDTLTLDCRRRYREAVQPLVTLGAIQVKLFKLGGVKVERRSVLDNECTVSGVDPGELLGAPVPGIELTLKVHADE